MKTLRYIAGGLLIFLGFVALITPLTPGSWLIFIGLEMLGIEVLFLRRFMTWMRERYAKRKRVVSL